jgi:hypothetical protein
MGIPDRRRRCIPDGFDPGKLRLDRECLLLPKFGETTREIHRCLLVLTDLGVEVFMKEGGSWE